MRFKSSVYIYKANHNKFNTSWGDYDFGLPFSLWSNQKALLEGDLKSAAHRFPEDNYITRFEDSDFKPLCTFEEDIDLTTGSVKGIRTEGKELLVWNERQG